MPHIDPQQRYTHRRTKVPGSQHGAIPAEADQGIKLARSHRLAEVCVVQRTGCCFDSLSLKERSDLIRQNQGVINHRVSQNGDFLGVHGVFGTYRPNYSLF